MEIKVTIKPNNDIPAFAGYLSGSIRDPEAKIVVNIEAMINASAEYKGEITFKEIFTTSVVHELLHAVQDFFGKAFDEEEVEMVIESASEMFYKKTN